MDKRELKESLQKRIVKLRHARVSRGAEFDQYYHDGLADAYESCLDLIDQLDEPDNYAKMALERGQQLLKVQSERDEAEKELRELKDMHSDKVIVPRGLFNPIDIRGLIRGRGFPKEYKIRDWFSENKQNEITFMRAWLDGFTVEEEQKYLVNILDEGTGAYLIYYPKSDNYGVTGILDDNKGITQFTEQEIKDYDERYWAFAVPVEELEE